MRLFEICGIAIHAMDARGMSWEEIGKAQALSAVAQQNAYVNGLDKSTGWIERLLGMANYMPAEPPLDERFADFKIRLADALEKRSLRKEING